MDKDTVTRWLTIALLTVGLYYAYNKFTGTSSDGGQAVAEERYLSAPGFAPDVIDPATDGQAPGRPAEGEICKIVGKRFEADLSSRGAALTHFRLTDANYASSDSSDLSTTPDIERWRSLRTLFRADGANDQFKFDRFPWTLNTKSAGGKTTACEFSFQDEDVQVVKTISAGTRPFELNVETKITNRSAAPHRHRFAIQEFGFRLNEEVKGSYGRQSPFVAELSCANQNDVTRKAMTDFKKSGWVEQASDRYVAITNNYFAQALVPERSLPEEQGTRCRLLSEDWHADNQKPDDDKAGHVFHAEIDYPARELAAGATATYKQTAFFGPKERFVLADAAGGAARLGDLIDLGQFSMVAKYLVLFVTWINTNVTFGSWGLAIVVLTLALRTALFPLTWKSIMSTVAMRRLKPEIDELNAKFKDDAQAKNLAMMELWRKNKVNPLGGCLPQLVQMPVWFAMYRTLQTAVEFYHEKFLWFSDLSAPDKFYILPLLLGGFMIIQQRIVPQQGMDPVQQKMMMWMMPAIFTVMMLFLPAALGIYMLTNSVLGIVQQLAVEKFAPRSGPPEGPAASAGLSVGGAGRGSAPGSFGKGNARV